jgi:hypothetical protein
MSSSEVVGVMGWRPLALAAGKASRSFASEFKVGNGDPLKAHRGSLSRLVEPNRVREDEDLGLVILNSGQTKSLDFHRKSKFSSKRRQQRQK